MNDAADKRTQLVRLALLIAAVILTAASFIGAPEYVWDGGAIYLQHLGTLFLLLPLAADLKLRSFTTPVCVCFFVYICLHILGARYLYSNVPYHEWAEQLFGMNFATPKDHANQYDRLVHFAFGLLLLPLFLRVAKKWLKIGNYAAALVTAWALVQSFSLLYEVFEWLLTVVVSSEVADDYNGQQGDMWDAQKDMLLALIGSTLTAAFLVLLRVFIRFRKRRAA